MFFQIMVTFSSYIGSACHSLPMVIMSLQQVAASQAVKLLRTTIQQAGTDCAATVRCGRVLSAALLCCTGGREHGVVWAGVKLWGRRCGGAGAVGGHTVKDVVGVQEGQRPRHVKRDAVAGVVPHGARVLAVDGVRKVASVHQLRAMTTHAVHVMRSAFCCHPAQEPSLSLSKEDTIPRTALPPVDCNAATTATQHLCTCLNTDSAARFQS